MEQALLEHISGHMKVKNVTGNSQHVWPTWLPSVMGHLSLWMRGELGISFTLILARLLALCLTIFWYTS